MLRNGSRLPSIRMDAKKEDELISAAMSDNYTAVRSFLVQGLDVNYQDGRGEAPIHWAAEYGNVQTAQVLIDGGCNVNIKDNTGSTPLHRASANEYLDVVTLLISEKADPLAADRGGSTALHWAVQEGKAKAVNLLLQHMSNIDIGDNGGATALHLASYHGNIEVVSILLQAGANVNVRTEHHGNTPMHMAAENGHISVVKLLLVAGSDINAQDSAGFTVLMLACRRGHRQLVEILLDAGANAEVKNNEGKRAIDFAKDRGIEGIIKNSLQRKTKRDSLEDLTTWYMVNNTPDRGKRFSVPSLNEPRDYFDSKMYTSLNENELSSMSVKKSTDEVHEGLTLEKVLSFSHPSNLLDAGEYFFKRHQDIPPATAKTQPSNPNVYKSNTATSTPPGRAPSSNTLHNVISHGNSAIPTVHNHEQSQPMPAKREESTIKRLANSFRITPSEPSLAENSSLNAQDQSKNRKRDTVFKLFNTISKIALPRATTEPKVDKSEILVDLHDIPSGKNPSNVLDLYESQISLEKEATDGFEIYGSDFLNQPPDLNLLDATQPLNEEEDAEDGEDAYGPQTVQALLIESIRNKSGDYQNLMKDIAISPVRQTDADNDDEVLFAEMQQHCSELNNLSKSGSHPHLATTPATISKSTSYTFSLDAPTPEIASSHFSNMQKSTRGETPPIKSPTTPDSGRTSPSIHHDPVLGVHAHSLSSLPINPAVMSPKRYNVLDLSKSEPNLRASDEIEEAYVLQGSGHRSIPIDQEEGQEVDQRLVHLLDALGLAHYIHAFVEEEWDWDGLLEITEQDMVDMGLKAGARRKLISAIKRVRKRAQAEFMAAARSKGNSKPEEQANQSDSPYQNINPIDITSSAISSSPEHKFEWEIKYEELQLIDYIGKGFYGNVYKGVWRSVDVAIKKITRQLDIRKWLMEVQMLASLRHPNIVNFYCACITPPNYCIVLEFMPRGSLRDVLENSSIILSTSKILDFAIDVSRGMLYLHSQDPPIIHRDLKADNLLVAENWKVKVSDFGLSRFKDETYSYMNPTSPFDVTITAPEVLEQNHISEKADVYSFGLLLCEMVTRKKGFAGKNPHWVAWTVVHNKLRPDLVEKDCSKEMKALIEDCWNQDYHSRPSFDDILESLTRMKESECTTSSEPYGFG